MPDKRRLRIPPSIIVTKAAALVIAKCITIEMAYVENKIHRFHFIFDPTIQIAPGGNYKHVVQYFLHPIARPVFMTIRASGETSGRGGAAQTFKSESLPGQWGGGEERERGHQLWPAERKQLYSPENAGREGEHKPHLPSILSFLEKLSTGRSSPDCFKLAIVASLRLVSSGWVVWRRKASALSR